MGRDGLLELDQSCWVVLAKYNLVLATAFGIAALAGRHAGVAPLVVAENGLLALLFGGVQTYAWLSA